MIYAIETTGLTKRYGNVTAVDDLSLHVGPGEIYAFLGLNGAGKTTTIRMLLGMVKASAGTVSVLGTPIRAGATGPWADVGYLVETPYAYPELTVRQNLEAVRRLRPGTSVRSVGAIIHQLGLLEYAERPAGTLSLGNAQRLGLAKALLHRPDLLILDEPANGLDPAGIVEIRQLLRRLVVEQGVTIFMSSHQLTEVARLADRIGIIHHGRLLREVDQAQLERDRRRWLALQTRDAAAAQMFLAAQGFLPTETVDGTIMLTEDTAIAAPEVIATQLVGAGLPPTMLAVGQEDLEHYFLRLVGPDGDDAS